MASEMSASQQTDSTSIAASSGVTNTAPASSTATVSDQHTAPVANHVATMQLPMASLLAKQKNASQGSWHVATPTLMTHIVFNKLLQPVSVRPLDICSQSASPSCSSSQGKDSQDSGVFLSQGSSVTADDSNYAFKVSPLEGFLGSVTLRSHLLRLVNERVGVSSASLLVILNMVSFLLRGVGLAGRDE